MAIDLKINLTGATKPVKPLVSLLDDLFRELTDRVTVTIAPTDDPDVREAHLKDRLTPALTAMGAALDGLGLAPTDDDLDPEGKIERPATTTMTTGAFVLKLHIPRGYWEPKRDKEGRCYWQGGFSSDEQRPPLYWNGKDWQDRVEACRYTERQDAVRALAEALLAWPQTHGHVRLCKIRQTRPLNDWERKTREEERQRSICWQIKKTLRAAAEAAGSVSP